MSVRISESKVFGSWIYRIFLDGTKYDMFMSDVQLTSSEQSDVLAGYREGLGLDSDTPGVLG